VRVVPQLSLDPRDSKWLGLTGAEIAPLSDGSRAVRLATHDTLFHGRLLEARESEGAVILAGPPVFTCTFLILARHFASAGVTALVLTAGESSRARDEVEAAQGFLKARGARRFGIAAAGDAAPGLLALAGARPEVEAVALFDPPSPLPRQVERLAGRPLLVFCHDPVAAPPRRMTPFAEALSFPGAGSSFLEVASDLGTMWVARWLPLLATDARDGVLGQREGFDALPPSA
jgi:hypothetical protein